MTLPKPPSRVLFTGATGIIGRELLARLLAAGVRVRLLVRGRPGESAERRVERLLADEDLSAVAGRVETIACDLGRPLLGLDESAAAAAARDVDLLLHVAASTVFQRTDSGEPFATNVVATANLLRFAERFALPRLVHVSTAYVAGRVERAVSPDESAAPPAFTNDYERSKFEAEQLVRRFAAASRVAVAVLRPGIVIGRHADGSIHRFTGLYPVLRTLDGLRARWRDRRDGPCELPLVLPGRCDYAPALVPLDWLGQVACAVVMRPDLVGRDSPAFFPIVHPAPPTVRALRDWVNAALDMRMGWIADEPGAPRPAAGERNVWQRAFDGQTELLRPYFGPGPTFLPGPAAGLIDRLGLAAPPLDRAYIHRLIAAARARDWGRGDESARLAPPPAGPPVPARQYFESFLPRRMPGSAVARVAAMTVTMGFEVAGVGRWDLRFEAGRLVEVFPAGRPDAAPDVLYRLDAATLADVIDARVSPQQAFLDDRVRIDGDMELALKLAMIFEQFMIECPTTVADLAGRSEETAYPQITQITQMKR